jgi:hypothetical protein
MPDIHRANIPWQGDIMQSSMAKKNNPKSSPLAAINASELRRELAVREQRIQQLHTLKNKLAARMADIDKEMAANGIAGGGGGPRPRNEVSLLDALTTALKGKELSVGDAIAAVEKAGYISTSPSFRVIVNQRLSDPKHFKRVGRGVYTAK